MHNELMLIYLYIYIFELIYCVTVKCRSSGDLYDICTYSYFLTRLKRQF